MPVQLYDGCTYDILTPKDDDNLLRARWQAGGTANISTRHWSAALGVAANRRLRNSLVVSQCYGERYHLSRLRMSARGDRVGIT